MINLQEQPRQIYRQNGDLDKEEFIFSLDKKKEYRLKAASPYTYLVTLIPTLIDLTRHRTTSFQ